MVVKIGLSWWLSDNLLANAGDASSIPGLGRSPREGNGNPRQHSRLENPVTEEPGRLQSGHDLTTKQKQQHAA